MAVITPQSDVYLIKVPLEIDNNNQLTFANASAQHTYFTSLPKKGYDDFTYIRKDGVLRIPAVMDDILSYNYVMYRNDAYSSKWFYAYITGMEYVNDSVTDVSIATDTFQTWQFDLTYKRTLVEREHVNDDTIGKHTVSEGLNLGELMINSKTTLKPSNVVKDSNQNALTNDYMIVFQVTSHIEVLAYMPLMAYNYLYNNVFSGLIYFGCASEAEARAVIQDFDSAGKSDEIVAIFMAPTQFFQGCTKHTLSNSRIVYTPASDQVTLHTLSTLTSETTITRPTKLNGYTPKNNKCFTYPYSFMNVTNNVGVEVSFNYEDFSNNTPKFEIIGALGEGCSTKLIPKNYKGQSEAGEYGIAGAKYPVCGWTSDYYTNWVTQNAVNQGISATTTLTSTLGSLATGTLAGGPLGAIIGGFAGSVSMLNEAQRLYASNYQAQIHPDQAKGNTNTSDMIVGWGKYFTISCMSVRAEIAEQIDKYFSMFGYKVNEVKVPNVTGRRNWNFVKTVGCYIDADIPQDDLQQIKDMFNKGITFWHNPATFCDYSQTNDII